MSGLAAITIGGTPRVVDLARGGRLIHGNFQSYAVGANSVWTGMWGKYLPQNDSLIAESTMRVGPLFPAWTSLAWDVTPDPDYSGINGFLHLACGNYDDSPGSITPRRVSAITDLRLAIDWGFTGDPSTGLLSECWLATTSATSGTFNKVFEVGFLPKLSAGAVSFVAGLPAVGVGSFTDGGGLVWNVRVADGAVPYFVAYRPGYADFRGTLPYRDYFSFLVSNGKITGSEWFNGVAFGAEPLSGAGSVTVKSFLLTYTGG